MQSGQDAMGILHLRGSESRQVEPTLVHRLSGAFQRSDLTRRQPQAAELCRIRVSEVVMIKVAEFADEPRPDRSRACDGELLPADDARKTWEAGFVQCIGLRLAGDEINDVDERGEPIVGDTLLMLVNAHHEPISFTLPSTNEGQVWEVLIDTFDMTREHQFLGGCETYDLQDRSMALLRTLETADVDETVTRSQMEALRKEAYRTEPPHATDAASGVKRL